MASEEVSHATVRGDSCKEFKVNGLGQLLFIKRKESTTAVSPLGLKKCCLVKQNTRGRACFNPSSAFLHLQTSHFGSILSVPVL